MANLIRVGLVDGDSDIRMGRRMLLEAQDDLQIVFEDDDAYSLLKRAPNALIDVLVVDHRLKSLDGVAAITLLAATYLEAESIMPRVILTGPYFSPELQLASLAAGATDLVTEEDGAEELLKAVRSTRAKSQNPNFAQLRAFLDTFEELPPPPIGFALNVANFDNYTEQVVALFLEAFEDSEISERVTIPVYRVRKTIDDLVARCGFATRAQLYLALLAQSRRSVN